MKKITLFLMSFALLFILVACTSKAKVTFDSDGGSECASIEVNVGSTIKLPANPTKEGYTFLGWYLGETKFDEKTAINKNITLKAKWEEILEEYTISYEIGEGANLSSNAPVKFKEGKGSEVKLPKPSKSGYIFLGWYENDVLVEALTENRDYALVAKWDVAETFEVLLKVDGVLYESFSVVEGETLADVELPENPVKEDYRFDGWYLNDEKFNFETTVVTSDLELNAKFTQVKKVIAYAVGLPKNITLYNTNKGDQNNDGDSKDDHNEFFIWNQSYLVGDDNNWTFKPSVTFYKFDLDEEGNLNLDNYEEVIPASWEYDIAIYKYNLETEKYDILVDNNDTAIIDAIDYTTCQINFADGIDKENNAFLVKVSPKGLTTNQSANKDRYTISMMIEVVDGFNVYTAKELAYINDRTDEYATAWEEFKKANGLELNYVANRVILHNDINITTNDLPKEFFYTEEEAKGQPDELRYYDVLDSEGNLVEKLEVKLAGSLKDYSYIYYRELEGTEELSIVGNYYKVDASSMPLVVRESKGDNSATPLGTVISHATLIKVDGSGSSNFVMENVSFLGNANRTEIAIKGGGIILTKINNTAATMKNNIASCFFISYMTELSTNDILIEKCRAYDAFNSFIYNWGSSKVTLKECEMIGAGGPVIIQDHVDPTSSDGGQVGQITIEDCKLEAYVAGTEGWFTLVGATSVVPLIKGMNALFNPLGRSFLKTNTASGETYMNLICVNKSGDAQSITAQKVSGSTTIIDSESETNRSFNFGATDPYLGALLAQTYSQGAPAFESSKGGYGYTDGATGIYDLQNNRLIDPTHAIYNGDYLAVYYNGMLIVLGYFNSGATYNVA